MVAPLAIMSVSPLIAHFCGRKSAIDCISFGSISIGQYIPLTIHVAITNKLPKASCCSGVLTLAAIISPMPTTANRKKDTNTISAAGLPQLIPNSQWDARSSIPNWIQPITKNDSTYPAPISARLTDAVSSLGQTPFFRASNIVPAAPIIVSITNRMEKPAAREAVSLTPLPSFLSLRDSRFTAGALSP